MKKNLLLTTCLLAASAAVFWSIGVSGQKAEGGESARTEAVAAPQAITVEDFTYATGALTLAGGANTSGGNWVNFSGTGNFIPVSSGSLSYTGYPSTGVGNKIDIISVATSAEDAHRQFATQGVGSTTYAAFMVNVANTTGMLLNTSTTGDYFAGFLPSTSTTLLNARVSVRQGAVSGFNLGLRATSANATTSFAAADLATGTTHLVVISYQVVAGDSNDVVRMWINPVITGTEPAADLTQTTASATDIVDIARFFVRQAATTTPNASLDGVRVSNNWANLITAQPQQHVVDTDGDGRTDDVVVRNTGGGPSGQITWFSNQTTGPDLYFPLGIASDQFVPEDYDGDNKTDFAIFRPLPGTGSSFYILQSSTSTIRAENFGLIGDQPDVVGDYNGDGSADLAVYRPGATAGAPSTWFYRTTPNGPVFFVPWGQNGDFPAPGDYDGNGSNDFVVQRNAGGGQARFFTLLSTGATAPTVVFGTPTDVIVPGDYDGDGKTDIATVRGIGGQINWFVLPSSGGAFTTTVFGLSATDFPVMGDYDGDGKTDFATWRPDLDPNNCNFWILKSTGGFEAREWGQNGDYPVANFNTH
jgi:hypothetical protein